MQLRGEIKIYLIFLQKSNVFFADVVLFANKGLNDNY
jgi:hypothetical protein